MVVDSKGRTKSLVLTAIFSVGISTFSIILLLGLSRLVDLEFGTIVYFIILGLFWFVPIFIGVWHNHKYNPKVSNYSEFKTKVNKKFYNIIFISFGLVFIALITVFTLGILTLPALIISAIYMYLIFPLSIRLYYYILNRNVSWIFGVIALLLFLLMVYFFLFGIFL